jgi:hypothetical protein
MFSLVVDDKADQSCGVKQYEKNSLFDFFNDCVYSMRARRDPEGGGDKF